MAQYRVGRVQQEILREVNELLQRKVKDPRTQGVTITEVELTGDLQQATIYYTTLQTSEKQRLQTQVGLDKASGIIRHELGRRLTLYKVPTIKFERDCSVDYGNHIDQLLEQINQEDEARKKEDPSK